MIPTRSGKPRTLRSSGGNMGAVGLRELCRDVERSAAQGDLTGASVCIDAIRREYEEASGRYTRRNGRRRLRPVARLSRRAGVGVGWLHTTEGGTTI